MATYTEKRLSPPAKAIPPRAHRSRLTAPRVAPQIATHAEGIVGIQERRRRRRTRTEPMYTCAIVRVLGAKNAILEGHVLDVSETGIAVELDSLIPIGAPVTIEFRIAGLGRIKNDQWSETAAAAEVVRHDHLDDFPHGPYKLALRFVRMSTMAQAHIARYVATHQ